MKKMMSFCLAVLLAFGMTPVTAQAADTQSTSLQEIEEAVRRNAKAEITDSEGNVVESLDVDVLVQHISTSRSSDGVEYAITCMAKSANNDSYSDSDSVDGYIGVLTMVCKDVFGTSNQLISVSGSFSGGESETTSRTVVYAAYDTMNTQTSRIQKDDVDQSYMYTPLDYTGFTFRAWSTAKIVATGHYLNMYVTTDSI